jgi:putative FmdB family regulatory protein
MPFYEYQCSACEHPTEVLQKISDAPLKKCPECGKQTLKRLISAPVFRLKGGGWYETDFKSDNETKRNIAGREEGEAKAEESKPETPAKEASSAPETKSEAKPADTKPSTAKPVSIAKVSGAKKPVAKPAAKKPKPAPKKKAARR